MLKPPPTTHHVPATKAKGDSFTFGEVSRRPRPRRASRQKNKEGPRTKGLPLLLGTSSVGYGKAASRPVPLIKMKSKTETIHNVKHDRQTSLKGSGKVRSFTVESSTPNRDIAKRGRDRQRMAEQSCAIYDIAKQPLSPDDQNKIILENRLSLICFALDQYPTSQLYIVSDLTSTHHRL